MTSALTSQRAHVIRVGLVLALAAGVFLWHQFTGPDTSEPAAVAAAPIQRLGSAPASDAERVASVLADALIIFGDGPSAVSSIDVGADLVRVKTTLRPTQNGTAADLTARACFVLASELPRAALRVRVLDRVGRVMDTCTP